MRWQDPKMHHVSPLDHITTVLATDPSSCIAYKDECHYDKPPSLAYVRSLEDEVHELKAQLRQARTQILLSKVGGSTQMASTC